MAVQCSAVQCSAGGVVWQAALDWPCLRGGVRRRRKPPRAHHCYTLAAGRAITQLLHTLSVSRHVCQHCAADLVVNMHYASLTDSLPIRVRSPTQPFQGSRTVCSNMTTMPYV